MPKRHFHWEFIHVSADSYLKGHVDMQRFGLRASKKAVEYSNDIAGMYNLGILR